MTLQDYLSDIQHKTVAVIGAGVSNTPLIGLLRKAGIAVTVHDRNADLGAQYEALAALGCTFSLGDGYLDTLTEDIIFRTPGVHPNKPQLDAVRARGGIVTSEMELFFAVCPCPIIGITGSDGKTTTTTLTCKFLEQAGYTCHLGGNIGKPLLPEVDTIAPDHLAVVELSSFQLMGMAYSPVVSAITNLTPNHLDYHKDFDEYVDAKTAIYTHQTAGDRLILNADDPVTGKLTLNPASTLSWCTKQGKPENGVYLENNIIYIAENGVSRPLMNAAEIRIPGAHNVSNVMMAAAIVQGYCKDEDIVHVAKTFGGVEHRIEFVRELDGVRWYNDSIASSPTRTMAGLNSFDRKLILIAGGYDKHIPYDVLGEPICEHVKTLILTGATAPKIKEATLAAPSAEKPRMLDAADLKDAVRIAREAAQPGDVVILSPASASFDCFKNFMERGNLFKQFVNELN
ncbi:MAG: UDP-N-acetylmuramoyl-L-alanine--D-glutamate ligase [Butyricicoccus sp.]|nr:UDP-N-acetylmuramoyl-L-alanine--D-glutamate ligase [Butyricicoccus sp.]